MIRDMACLTFNHQRRWNQDKTSSGTDEMTKEVGFYSFRTPKSGDPTSSINIAFYGDCPLSLERKHLVPVMDNVAVKLEASLRVMNTQLIVLGATELEHGGD